jgi:mevalonate kinase
MKKSYEKLVNTITYLRDEHTTLPNHVFDALNEVKNDILKVLKKKRCKRCDRFDHYDEVMGIWTCEQCDKYPKENEG